MGSIGPPELIVIGVLALLVFGPKRLPEIGKNVGAAIREFRRASRDIMSHFEDDAPPRARSFGRYGYQPDPYPAMPADSGYDGVDDAPAAAADTADEDHAIAAPAGTAAADPRTVATAAPSANGDSHSLTASTPAGTTTAEAERKA